MTLIDFDKKELLDISHALLSYRTDSTVIREGRSNRRTERKIQEIDYSNRKGITVEKCM